VLTLQLPTDGGSLPSFLNHVWAFDHAASTAEDQNRTRMYQQNRERQEYREQSPSLKDFLGGLQLQVQITEATQGDLGRVSQLTLRTNQFNFTTLRRSESEITAFLQRQQARCLAVRVVDRFGDYGLVGVLMYESAAERYKVDTLLLSCRVLGRGVEHALVSWLGQRAVEEGKRFVELTCVPTQKNLPALEFIAGIGEGYRSEAGASWIFPAERLAAVAYNPDEAPPEHEVPAIITPGKPAPRTAFGSADRSERLQRIAENLCDIQRLAAAIETYRLGEQPRQVAAEGAPGDGLEAALVRIWRKVLGKRHIGLHDNFFEAGGTSVRAVQMVAMIRQELQHPLSIVSVFECPTVALLAARMGGASGERRGEPAIEAAAVRGQQRRYNAVRRKAS
jgi:hypothetical protein